MFADLKGRKILVVGGAGYIGAHVCKRIQKHGGIPVTLDNLSAGREHSVRYGPLDVRRQRVGVSDANDPSLKEGRK